jgi:hypothetical protein
MRAVLHHLGRTFAAPATSPLNENGTKILALLQGVAAERVRRSLDAGLAARVRAVKAFQHARFRQSYADLMADKRYASAAQFFLDDLYGPRDFAQRDDQFARIVPALVRLFPREIVETVLALAELHALSEHFDSAMAAVLPDEALRGASYSRAWRAVGQAGDRERQIALMLSVGAALDGYTRNMLMRHSLRLMRAPAHAAGMGALQEFLERGFDTFRQMRGADEFLARIAQRERALAAQLFAGGDAPDPSAPPNA